MPIQSPYVVQSNYVRGWFVLMLFCLAGTTGFGQKKIKTVSEPLPVTILNVTKMDAQARPNPRGKGRLVPVHLEWKVASQEGVKLVSLEATLMTSNTDGTTTNVKKMLANTGNEAELMLEMPDEVFAKDFKLTLVANCAWDGGGGSSRAIKSGSFPVVARNK